MVRFNEMEYNIPAEHARAVLQEIEECINQYQFEVNFPLEFRFVLADDIWLSPAYQRESAYIAVHMYRGMAYRPYFAAMEAIFGPTGTIIMAIVIMISTFGCNNGLILAGARVYYAMARDNVFFKRVGTVNSQHVPAVALIAQGIWSAFLTLPRTVTADAKTGKAVYGNVYTQLIEYLTSADLIFYGLMVAAVIVLRKKAANVDRPYRTFGYPIVPVIYITIALLFVLDLGYLAPRTSGIGYLLVLTGIPAYLIWKKQAKAA